MAELNLIPSSTKIRYLQKNQSISIVFVIIIVSAVMFLSLFIPYFILQQFRNKEADLRSQVNAQSSVIEERNMMMEQMTRTKELITLVDNADKDKQIIYQYIVDLQNILPADINCTSLNYTAEAITISGISENYKSPAEFVANLQESETFKNANLVNISSSDSGYVFSINVKLMK